MYVKEIKDIYFEVASTLEKLKYSLLESPLFKDVQFKSMYDKRGAEKARAFFLTKGSKKTPKIDYFDLDEFIERLFVDRISAKLIWNNFVVDGEAKEYILNNLSAKPFDKDQLRYLKGMLDYASSISGDYFDSLFVGQVDKVVESYFEKHIPCNELYHTWHVINVTTRNRCVVFHDCGDWRISEWERLFKTGALDEVYKKDSRKVRLKENLEDDETLETYGSSLLDSGSLGSLAIARNYAIMYGLVEDAIKSNTADKFLEHGFVTKGKSGIIPSEIAIMDYISKTQQEDLFWTKAPVKEKKKTLFGSRKDMKETPPISSYDDAPPWDV